MSYPKHTAVFFTGHRQILRPQLVDNVLSHVLIQYIQSGFNRFITGMAGGFDQLAADVVLRLRTAYPHIQLVAAIPFLGQERVWPDWLKAKYHGILAQVNERNVVCDGAYEPWKMQERNKWMVNNATCGIGYWNGIQKGGTWNCINYAIHQYVHLHIISPEGRVITADPYDEVINGKAKNITI